MGFVENFEQQPVWIIPVVTRELIPDGLQARAACNNVALAGTVVVLVQNDGQSDGKRGVHQAVKCGKPDGIDPAGLVRVREGMKIDAHGVETAVVQAVEMVRAESPGRRIVPDGIGPEHVHPPVHRPFLNFRADGHKRRQRFHALARWSGLAGTEAGKNRRHQRHFAGAHKSHVMPLLFRTGLATPPGSLP